MAGGQPNRRRHPDDEAPGPVPGGGRDEVKQTVPADSVEGRFRLAAVQVLDERAEMLAREARGVLDLSDPARADSTWLAARRTRAALELFKPCLSKSNYRAAREEVTRIGQAAGARRDVDAAIALCEAVIAEMGGPEAEGGGRVVARLRREQAERNRELAIHVHGRRLQAFKLRTEDLVASAVRPVEGTHPETVLPLSTLPETMVELVARRLNRLRSLAPVALQPEADRDHHRMRVAAERLRYSLELTAGAFGSQAHTARRSARSLQEILTELRDCDLIVDPVRETIATLEREDIEVLVERARGSRDLDPILVHAVPNRAGYRGLELILLHALARRRMMFDQFRRLWMEQSRQGVWVALATALGG